MVPLRSSTRTAAPGRRRTGKETGCRKVARRPTLARAIAGQVMDALDIVPTRPKGVVELGDPGLLALDMSGAAAHFGVDAPAGRRDRKSGATKRKQIDIERERLAQGVEAHG